jgi:hypothetical protein
MHIAGRIGGAPWEELRREQPAKLAITIIVTELVQGSCRMRSTPQIDWSKFAEEQEITKTETVDHMES